MSIRYIYRCEDYESKRYATREAAQKAADAATSFGACKHAHNVIAIEKIGLAPWRDVQPGNIVAHSLRGGAAVI